MSHCTVYNQPVFSKQTQLTAAMSMEVVCLCISEARLKVGVCAYEERLEACVCLCINSLNSCLLKIVPLSHVLSPSMTIIILLTITKEWAFY